jgi:hypothetical protein
LRNFEKILTNREKRDKIHLLKNKEWGVKMKITKEMSRSKRLTDKPIEIAGGDGFYSSIPEKQAEYERWLKEQNEPKYFHVDPEFTYDSYYFSAKNRYRVFTGDSTQAKGLAEDFVRERLDNLPAKTTPKKFKSVMEKMLRK